MSLLRQIATGTLVVATFALAGAGFLMRVHLAGILLMTAAIIAAVGAWLAFGAPITRRDIRR